MMEPVGDQTGPVAPPLSFVSCERFPPSASAIQSCPPAMYAMRRPSGDQRASLALTSSLGKTRADPPVTDWTYVLPLRRLAPMSVVRTTYSTDRPSGDICGSETARTAAKSSKLIGRCCAPND